ncbi:transcriptional regulator, IclR family [Jatrophihabitans endophyticus]|uniref:Transcriptional regulator, IclR family n=1 Tax=Jatrophihabitans endophyticus TaxID=1206085 RepID=A0A1M5S2F9_9ACTN|nr:IclR family transcriptional regulator [Jatrophihabitans endophyticus]SHH32777.1 transcriptional regulator, IclR family [Jatrophihabitans endophyticus]
MKDEAEKSGTNLIGVERTVKVLQAVEQAETAHLAEVARRAGLNEATTLRYLSTLTALGFIERLDGPRYQLGWEAFRLGQRALDRYVPRALVRPVMESLVREYNETVNFAMRRDRSVVLVDVLEGGRAVKKVSDVGQVDPWHASALGKALLATMDASAWRELVGSRKLPAFTPRTITSLSRLAAELEGVRRQGYAVDHEEADEDLTCLAAAVPRPSGGPAVYAISVSFLTHRLDPATTEAVGRRVRACADQLGAELG